MVIPAIGQNSIIILDYTSNATIILPLQVSKISLDFLIFED